MTLTNIQIDNLAIKYKIPNFKCIMNNELNGIPKRDCNIIINLENDNLSGSHWCAIIVKNKQKIYHHFTPDLTSGRRHWRSHLFV